MKIFILEDSPLRNNQFFEELARTGSDVTMATSVEEAQHRHEPPYDIYLLDHDLGGKTFVPSEDPETGYAFLQLPEVRKTIKNQKLVIVHSYNYDGAIRMVKSAEDAGANAFRMPFGPALFTWLRQLLAMKQKEVA